jgi:hypothetical protein
MAALTSDQANQYSNSIRNTQRAVIKNATQLYVGGLTDVVAGVAQPHVAGAGTSIGGIAVGPGVPGNSPILDYPNLGAGIGPGVGSAIPLGNVTTVGAAAANQVVLETGEVVLLQVLVTVAGALVGSAADIGQEVYCATSNVGQTGTVGDVSTTQTSSDKPLGHISWYYPGTYSAVAGTALYDIQVLDAQVRKGY